MGTSFIAGIFIGGLIGFLLATLCHIASEIDEKEDLEKDNKE